MVINGISSGNLLSGILKNGLAADEKNSEAITEVTEAQAAPETSIIEESSVSAIAPRTSSNMMAGNFFNRDYERSEYLEASLSARKQDKDFYSRMNSLVSGLSARGQVWDDERQFGGATPQEDTYVFANRYSTASSAATEQVEKDETMTHSEKNLEKARDDIEERAEEAATKKEETGASAPAEEANSGEVASPAETTGEQTGPVDAAGTGTVPPADPEESATTGAQAADTAQADSSANSPASPASAKLDITV